MLLHSVAYSTTPSSSVLSWGYVECVVQVDSTLSWSMLITTFLNSTPQVYQTLQGMFKVCHSHVYTPQTPLVDRLTI